MGSSSDTKVLHRLIRFISSLAVDTFFTEVRVIGGENVPKDGPIIVYVISLFVSWKWYIYISSQYCYPPQHDAGSRHSLYEIARFMTLRYSRD